MVLHRLERDSVAEPGNVKEMEYVTQTKARRQLKGFLSMNSLSQPGPGLSPPMPEEEPLPAKCSNNQ